MRFSISKAVVFGVTMFVSLAIGLSLSGEWRTGVTLIAAAVGGVFGAVLFGFVMREASVDVAGATSDTVEAAIRASWALRGFRVIDNTGGVVRYKRGIGVLGDVFTVTPTATGVTLTGAANIMSVIKKKVAGR